MIQGSLVVIITAITLLLGFTVGWLSSERFSAYLAFESHEYDELFEKNPHPELFDSDGQLNRGEYINLVFDPGYDPDKFDPDDIQEIL